MITDRYYVNNIMLTIKGRLESFGSILVSQGGRGACARWFGDGGIYLSLSLNTLKGVL